MESCGDDASQQWIQMSPETAHPKIINSTLSKKLVTEHSAISINVFVEEKSGNFKLNSKPK